MKRGNTQIQDTKRPRKKGIKVIELRKEIRVKMKAEDYVTTKWYVNQQTKRISAQITPRVPRSGLSTYMKGSIGELIAGIIMNCAYGGIDGLIERQKAGYVFDILDQHTGLRYDVKFSPLKIDKGINAAYWKFHFATNKGKKDAPKVSGTKCLKDYTKCCDAFILIGLCDDPEEKFEMYIINSNSEDVVGKRNIQIPASGRGRFARYRVDMKTFSCRVNGNDGIEVEEN